MLEFEAPALSAFCTGFTIGLSLIMAIGAQNAFVLRQGLLRHHVFAVALFCAMSDALLIAVGVGGISLVIGEFAERHLDLLFGFASLWLAVYGALRLQNVIQGDASIIRNNGTEVGLVPTLAITAMHTFGNPHVYLDTVFLIGSISNSLQPNKQIPFLIGTITSSFLFFFFLGYIGYKIGPMINTPSLWKKINITLGIIMILIAFNLIYVYLLK